MPRSRDGAATVAGSPAAQPVVVHVPVRFRRRGGRKLVVVDSVEGTGSEEPSYADPGLVKALARAFSWQRQIDNGEVASIIELAQAEGLSSTYAGRVLRLTLLAPEIVEEIIDGNDVGDRPAALKGNVPNLRELQREQPAYSSDQSALRR